MILKTKIADITLRDVLHVLDIGSNLLSVAKVVNHKHHLRFTLPGGQIVALKGYGFKE